MTESIYNLLPKEREALNKDAMYQSQWDPHRIYAGSTFGCSGTTRLIGAGKLERKTFRSFGPHTGGVKPLPPNSLTMQLVKPHKETNTRRKLSPENRRAPIPSRDDQPIVGLKSEKNFITTNAVEVILKEPKRPSPEPDYLHKEDYGKVPAYLAVVKEEVQREKELVQRYLKGPQADYDDCNTHVEQLPEKERIELVRALKLRWAEVNSEYQRSAHLVQLDTIGKVRRKEKLESELTSLERDIQRLEHAQTVVVTD